MDAKSIAAMRRDRRKNLKRRQAYRCWYNMKARCLDPRHKHYKHYGGRGIRICKRWLNSFDAFIKDMGYAPNGKTLDRIDTNGGYSPKNCRWATPLEQANNMRTNVKIALGGRNLTIQAWSRETGLSTTTIRLRLRRGLPPERILLKNGPPCRIPWKPAILARTIQAAEMRKAGISWNEISEKLGVKLGALWSRNTRLRKQAELEKIMGEI